MTVIHDVSTINIVVLILLIYYYFIIIIVTFEFHIQLDVKVECIAVLQIRQWTRILSTLHNYYYYYYYSHYNYNYYKYYHVYKQVLTSSHSAVSNTLFI